MIVSGPSPGADAMLRQLERLADDLRTVVDAVDRQLASILAEKAWSRTRSVHLVGSGDSRHAAGAATMAFHTIGGVDCRSAGTLPFLGYTPPPAGGTGEGGRPLVVAITASGATPLVLEAVQRARRDGCRTLALTTTAGSPVTRAADGAVVVELPGLERSPGVRTFQANLAGLLVLAIRLGEVRGGVAPDRAATLRRELRALADAVEVTHGANRTRCREVAELVADAPAQLVLGSGPSHGTAQFAAAKLTEGAGVFAAAQDVEEWWHVERFAYPVDMPLFVVAPPGPAHRRAGEIAAAARGLGRRVVAVTPAEDVHVARHAAAVLPVWGAPREEFSPLLYHLFAGAVAAALAALLGRSPFQSDRPALRAGMDAYLARAHGGAERSSAPVPRAPSGPPRPRCDG